MGLGNTPHRKATVFLGGAVFIGGAVFSFSVTSSQEYALRAVDTDVISYLRDSLWFPPP